MDMILHNLEADLRELRLASSQVHPTSRLRALVAGMNGRLDQLVLRLDDADRAREVGIAAHTAKYGHIPIFGDLGETRPGNIVGTPGPHRG